MREKLPLFIKSLTTEHTEYTEFNLIFPCLSVCSVVKDFLLF